MRSAHMRTRGWGPMGPRTTRIRKCTACALGRNQYEYVCATPEELVFGMARLLDAVDGAHFLVYPRQTLRIPAKDECLPHGRVQDGVYPYKEYGNGRPLVYRRRLGDGTLHGRGSLAALAEREGLSSLLLSGFSISLFHDLPYEKRTEISPKGPTSSGSILWRRVTRTWPACSTRCLAGCSMPE